MKPIISVKNLSKHYNGLKAVNDISFEVQKGEVFGILGPNGAGKTTTLEMMETLRKIDKGTVLLNDINVTKEPDKVRQIIGVQLQASTYFDFLNLREILDLFGQVYHRSVNTDELLEEVALTEKAGAWVKALSGGQKQRMSIASALVNDPIVLFLDEPTTGLDPQARRHLWGLVKQINQKGKTIIITTHYMEEAQVLCNRVAIMDAGKIIAIDTPDKLIKKHGGHSEIEFELSADINEKKCQAMHNVKGVKHDSGSGKYIIKTDDPESTLIDLLSEAKKINCHLKRLNVKQPSLEDVFLNLTGRSLRE